MVSYGKDNNLTDSLSCDSHLSNSQLTSLFHKPIPSQTPSNLKISPLPQKIESLICLLLQTLPEKMQQPEKHNPSKISLGVDGLNSLNQLDLEKIPSSQTLTEEAEQLSPQHLQRQSEQENFQDNLIPPSSCNSSQHCWQRFSDLQRLCPVRSKVQ